MKIFYILTVSTLLTSTAFAGDSFSLGYSHAKITDGDKLQGLNLKATNDLNDKWGVIYSLNFMQGKSKATTETANSYYQSDSLTKYFSASVGPTYKVNKYLNFYGLLGLGVTNATLTKNTVSQQEEYHRRSPSLTYGIGTQINITPNFLVDIGYEGTKSNNAIDNKLLNSFNIGIGYKF